MRRAHSVAAGLAVVCALLVPVGLGPQAVAADSPKVLILHDSGSPYGGLGADYALMLRNLLGHFDAAVTTKPVTTYAAGQMSGYTATFYVGSTFDEPYYYPVGSPALAAYEAFLDDAASNRWPLVWMGENLWKLAWDPARTFTLTFGLNFVGNDYTGVYNRVEYKKTELLKGVVVHQNPGAVLTNCVPEPNGYWDCATNLTVVRIGDATKASSVARTYSTATAASAPYVLHAGKLWYVADIPFSYLSDEDRYLAFADLLHDMLGVLHAERHLALARFEDVHPDYDVSELNAVAKAMRARKAPYSVALIPVYKDPFGVLNGGRPVTRDLLDRNAGDITDALKRYVRNDGASIVQHGTTHQADFGINPYNGVSGDDFEFYKVTENADHSLSFVSPVPGDSATWATARVNTGRDLLSRAGLPAFAFEPPHYLASQTDYQAIQKLYPVQYARVVYYPTSDRSVGQFFPFVTTDAYGHRIVPENIGNVEPDDFNGFAMSFPQDLIRRAKKALVVRDGFASFFYHPFLGPQMLDEVVRGVQALGYTFVRACDVAGSCPRGTGKM